MSLGADIEESFEVRLRTAAYPDVNEKPLNREVALDRECLDIQETLVK
jgi:hypothetical protein